MSITETPQHDPLPPRSLRPPASKHLVVLRSASRESNWVPPASRKAGAGEWRQLHENFQAPCVAKEIEGADRRVGSTRLPEPAGCTFLMMSMPLRPPPETPVSYREPSPLLSGHLAAGAR